MTAPTSSVDLPTAVSWSVLVQRLDTPATLIEHRPDTVCATASIGKILLLVTAAEAIARGDLDPKQPLSRVGIDPVRDSGQWQHLTTDVLPLVDVCALIGSTSDNLATNVLVTQIGLDTVADCAARLGMVDTALHDIVRDVRTSAHPPALSTANATELVALCAELHRPQRIDPSAANTVIGWLSTNTDLSMVASALGLDPLAHGRVDRGVRLWNKTGTNVGVRCDVGVVQTEDCTVAYAALANWQPDGRWDARRDAILGAMRSLGEQVLIALEVADR